MNLTELENLYREIESRMDDPDFNPTEALSTLGEQTEQKIDAYCFIINKLIAREEWCKQEANRLQELARTAKNEANRLKSHLMWFLEQRCLQKVITDRYRVSICNNGGKPPLVINEDISPEDVPDRYRIVSYQWNTDAIREAAETGTISWAKIGERGKSLRIK